MLWLMAKYANGIAEQKRLGIHFQAIVPMQMIGGTGVGGEGSRAYARAAGIEPEAFLTRFGAPMPPRLPASTWCGSSTTLNTTRRSLSG